jgi:hypothetical protein
MANLKFGAEVPVAEIRSGMEQSAEAVRAATSKMKIHFTEMEHSTGESVRRSREAVKLAAEQMHVHMDRSLTGIIAKSQLIGPAFAAAFEVTAAAAFAGVLIALVPKIQNLASSIGGFTDAMRESFNEAVKLNEQLMKTFDNSRIGRMLLEQTHLQMAAKDSEIAAAQAMKETSEISVNGLAERTLWSYKLIELQNELEALKNRERDQIKQLGIVQKAEREEEEKAAKQSLTDAQAAMRKRQELAQAQRAMDLEAGNAAMRSMKEGTQAEVAELEVRNGRFFAALFARLNAVRAERDQEHALDSEDLKLAEQLAQIELERARQSHTLTLAEERRYLDKVFEAKRLALQREIEFLSGNDPSSVLKKRQLHNQLIIEERRYQQQVESLERSHVGRMKQIIDGLNLSMASGFQSAIDGMIRGTQTLGQAFQEIMFSMLNSIVGVLAQMLAQWITTHIIMKIFGQSTAVATAQTQIAAAAGIAGANGVASFSLAPWPIDMGAPAFGASMAATARAFGALPKFNKGGIIPGSGNSDTVPIMATPGELVVRKELTPHVMAFLGTAAGTAGRQRAMPSRGGSVVINNKFSSLDGQSVARVLRNNTRAIVREHARLLRNGVRFRTA